MLIIISLLGWESVSTEEYLSKAVRKRFQYFNYVIFGESTTIDRVFNASLVSFLVIIVTFPPITVLLAIITVTLLTKRSIDAIFVIRPLLIV